MSMRRFRAATAVAILAAVLISAPATADVQTSNGAPLSPNHHFTMALDGSSGLTTGGEFIPNIDSVKSTIRAYYNATSAGIASRTGSPYISELAQIQADTLAALPTVDPAEHQAIVFDADDTTLWTYDMEDNLMHFDFDPALQATWVFDQKFPAVPGMVDFVAAVQAKGYAIFGLTGRRGNQKDATLGNLAKDGYSSFTADNFFTKWVGADNNKPSYVTCVAACTTVEYKANTRKHIEQDLGYDIVLNIGDQWSDLLGGYADRALKLPNPTYYLPSPNLPGVDQPELARVEADNTNRLVNRCKRLVRAGDKPAVVFDADDTTLWTYDMEDNAMHFNFDPVKQNNDWVQPQKLPATPGMPALVNAVGDAGCTVVGLTGRRANQRDATLGNLAKAGYTAFTGANYYTKWASGATPDPAIYPAGTPCADGVCTTIEYKSATRAYVESQRLHIIANFGDQWSDLVGGHADRTVKMPNPTYYLP